MGYGGERMKVHWVIIHKVAWLLGSILSFPFRPFAWWIPERRDVQDQWSFSHALATALLYWFFYSWIGVRWIAVLMAWFIMLIYEIWIDGMKLEDPRGASRADVGYNTIGVILAWMASLGSLLR